MRITWSTAFVGLLATQQIAAAADIDRAVAAMKRGETTEFIKLVGEQYLQEIYDKSGAQQPNSIERARIGVEVRSGSDGICYSGGALKVAGSIVRDRAATIILCESDLTTVVDFGMTQAVSMAFSVFQVMNSILEKAPEIAPEIARIKSPKDIASLSPATIEQLKTAVRFGEKEFEDRKPFLAKYYIEQNRSLKRNQLLGTTNSTRPCFAWQFFYLSVIKKDSSASNCTQGAVSPAQNKESIAVTIQMVAPIFSQIYRVEDFSTRLSELTSTQDREIQESVLVNIRWVLLERLIYYAVAHEFGHIKAHDDETQVGLQGELNADRFALTAINQYVNKAMALPFLAASLAPLWEIEGSPDGKIRSNSLRKAVLCNEGAMRSALTEGVTDINLLPQMAQGCIESPR